MNINTLAKIIDQPWFIVILLVAFFGIIVLAVILIKKYAKPFQNTEKPKTDKEIAAEEVNRLVVNPEDEVRNANLEEASEDLVEESERPNTDDFVEEEVSRATETIEDPELQRQMEEYAKAHPEEFEAAKEEAEK